MKYYFLLILLFPSLAVAVTKEPIRVIANVTGYSSTIRQTDSSPLIAADGYPVFDGGIACPRNIPFGAIVQFGGREFICNDRMSLANDGDYDIWFSSEHEAIEFGRWEEQVVYVY